MTCKPKPPVSVNLQLRICKALDAGASFHGAVTERGTYFLSAQYPSRVVRCTLLQTANEQLYFRAVEFLQQARLLGTGAVREAIHRDQYAVAFAAYQVRAKHIAHLREKLALSQSAAGEGRSAA